MEDAIHFQAVEDNTSVVCSLQSRSCAAVAVGTRSSKLSLLAEEASAVQDRLCLRPMQFACLFVS